MNEAIVNQKFVSLVQQAVKGTQQSQNCVGIMRAEVWFKKLLMKISIFSPMPVSVFEFQKQALPAVQCQENLRISFLY